MPSQYYKKDIFKSIEGLLYGLYVYQYLLDTSTFGLLIRAVVQDQFLSPKTKAPTLRIALYTIFATTFLALFRHQRTPDHFAVVIDFIGNVSPPSRSKLLWLDVFITALQISEALIVFNFLKAGGSASRTEPASTEQPVREEGQSNAGRHRAQNYHATSTSTNGAGSTSETDHSSSSGDEADDVEDEDPLGDDYQEIIEQEAFVLQVQFWDFVSYLFSNQEAVSFPRIPDPRTMATTARAGAEAARVQNLPV
ncbi:hypothetical protein EDD21DRAFT_131971 [Dissophora ornata]|nr:hypothetical protein EDD21DRAFT_131971 [Dissophora ornata]